MMNDTREILHENFFPNSRSIQYLLTTITGKPHKGQALPQRSPVGVILRIFFIAMSGITIGIYAISYQQYWLLPFAWIMTVYVMRYSQVVLIHHCAHFNVINQKVDSWLGNILSWLLVITPFSVYREKHVRTHHSWKSLSSASDPSVEYLSQQGLVSGVEIKQLKIRVLIALFSLRNHLQQILQRIQANLTNGWLSSMGFIAAIGVHVVLAVSMGWLSYVLIIVLPLTIFYQQTQFLRIIVEHWRAPSDDCNRNTQCSVEFTSAIFPGIAPPQRGVIAWLGWIWQMMLSILVRLLVLPGDNVVHDHHHVCPRANDWPNYIRSRQQHTEMLAEQGQADAYHEVWGYASAFNYSLKSISQSKI